MSDDKYLLMDALLPHVKFGEFTLSSGKTSDLYIDVRQVSLSAQGSVIIARMVLDRIKSDVVGVGGLTVGADPISASATAWSIFRLGREVHSFIVRKEEKSHGTKEKIEGLYNLPPGSKVCIVEDVTTSGVSILKSVMTAREADLDVVQTLTVFDRDEGASELLSRHGLVLESLVRRRELLLYDLTRISEEMGGYSELDEIPSEESVRETILRCLSEGLDTRERICKKTNFTDRQVHGTLTSLALEDKISLSAGRWTVLRK